MPESDTSTFLVTRVVIERHLTPDGDQYSFEFTDGNDGEPALVEVLGMCDLAKATAIQAQGDGFSSGCDCEDED